MWKVVHIQFHECQIIKVFIERKWAPSDSKNITEDLEPTSFLNTLININLDLCAATASNGLVAVAAVRSSSYYATATVPLWSILYFFAGNLAT